MPLGTMGSVVVECGFASNPLDNSQTWTDISAYVRDWQTTHGRSLDNPLGFPAGHSNPARSPAPSATRMAGSTRRTRAARTTRTCCR